VSYDQPRQTVDSSVWTDANLLQGGNWQGSCHWLCPICKILLSVLLKISWYLEPVAHTWLCKLVLQFSEKAGKSKLQAIVLSGMSLPLSPVTCIHSLSSVFSKVSFCCCWHFVGVLLFLVFQWSLMLNFKKLKNLELHKCYLIFFKLHIFKTNTVHVCLKVPWLCPIGTTLLSCVKLINLSPVAHTWLCELVLQFSIKAGRAKLQAIVLCGMSLPL